MCLEPVPTITAEVTTIAEGVRRGCLFTASVLGLLQIADLKASITYG